MFGSKLCLGDMVPSFQAEAESGLHRTVISGSRWPCPYTKFSGSKTGHIGTNGVGNYVPSVSEGQFYVSLCVSVFTLVCVVDCARVVGRSLFSCAWDVGCVISGRYSFAWLPCLWGLVVVWAAGFYHVVDHLVSG